MEKTLTPKKAKEILSMCEEMDALAKKIQSHSAFVRVEMTDYLSGVGTAFSSKKINKKLESEAKIRAKFLKSNK